MNTKRTLYRDTRQGKLGGVCAGLATYFNIEIWLVRICVISAFLLTTGPFVFVAYVAAWLILDKAPHNVFGTSDNEVNYTSQGSGFTPKGYTNVDTQNDKVCVKSRVWQAGMPPKQAFVNLQQRFIRSENRLRKVESYVTSKEFQLNRELNRL